MLDSHLRALVHINMKILVESQQTQFVMNEIKGLLQVLLLMLLL